MFFPSELSPVLHREEGFQVSALLSASDGREAGICRLHSTSTTALASVLADEGGVTHTSAYPRF